jgi:hypothetical protein
VVWCGAGWCGVVRCSGGELCTVQCSGRSVECRVWSVRCGVECGVWSRVWSVVVWCVVGNLRNINRLNQGQACPLLFCCFCRPWLGTACRTPGTGVCCPCLPPYPPEPPCAAPETCKSSFARQFHNAHVVFSKHRNQKISAVFARSHLLCSHVATPLNPHVVVASTYIASILCGCKVGPLSLY